MMLLKVAVAYHLLLCNNAGASLPSEWNGLDEDYPFAQFVKDYGKIYKTDAEFRHRGKIFEQNLRLILAHNRERKGHDHFLGNNHLMDLEKHELPLGYNKHFGGAAVSQTQRQLANSHEMELPFEIDEVTALPDSVNWRSTSTPIKDQGRCGSCWAFASTAALESHIAIQTGTLYSLSVQELVSCAPNAMNCGGYGGCTGATGQVAYDFVASAGIVQEWQFGYGSYDGAKVNCTLINKTSNSQFLRGPDPPGIKGAVATIVGYAQTPLNDYKALMNTVAKVGPVAVSVAASNWHLYKGGVFEDHTMNPQSTDINHLVVLEGYGTDEETGKGYWMVRNSWGPRWGESGFIRLLRVDPATLVHPDDDCGEDTTPSDGDACNKDENGNDIVPVSEKVCGTSGIYYNGVFPIGGRLA